ncbi:hypothetical protein EDB81DRAFT_950227 [Dactylonectria macrodidyma]|uniref:Uncharacterized protein n=1 Tax=Dactylonectria macrodidyma TaxID=307937 RepID=A0A9P9E8D2_9HYPO|nr:hypothetical protein EDB81DRAFT_950227 [Dactylonectria macrodidyma]
MTTDKQEKAMKDADNTEEVKIWIKNIPSSVKKSLEDIAGDASKSLKAEQLFICVFDPGLRERLARLPVLAQLTSQGALFGRFIRKSHPDDGFSETELHCFKFQRPVKTDVRVVPTKSSEALLMLVLQTPGSANEEKGKEEEEDKVRAPSGSFHEKVKMRNSMDNSRGINTIVKFIQAEFSEEKLVELLKRIGELSWPSRL